MKITLTLLLLSLSMHALADQRVDETLTVRPNGEVNIKLIDGEVSVQAWDKSEVRVTGSFDDDDAKLEFKTSGRATTIEIKRSKGHWGGHSGGSDADLEIYIPSNSSLNTSGVSTDFNISKVKGGIDISTVSGDIEAEQIGKRLELASVSGDIKVADSSGPMTLGSVSGDIEVEGNAPQFEAETVSGDIEAHIGKAENVELSTVSGDIELFLSLAKDGRISAETISGDIDIEFEEKVVNARFELDTGPGGDIVNRITDDKPEESWIGSGNINFTSGNGKGSVKIDTHSGTIEVSN